MTLGGINSNESTVRDSQVGGRGDDVRPQKPAGKKMTVYEALKKLWSSQQVSSEDTTVYGSMVSFSSRTPVAEEAKRGDTSPVEDLIGQGFSEKEAEEFVKNLTEAADLPTESNKHAKIQQIIAPALTRGQGSNIDLTRYRKMVEIIDKILKSSEQYADELAEVQSYVAEKKPPETINLQKDTNPPTPDSKDEYGKYGKTLEISSFKHDGSVNIYWRNEYDENGNEISTTGYNADGSITCRYESEYDENGNKTRFINRNPDGSVKECMDRVCDKYGNEIYIAYRDSDGNVTSEVIK